MLRECTYVVAAVGNVVCVAYAFTADVGVKLPYVAVANVGVLVFTQAGVTVTVPAASWVLYLIPVTCTVAESPDGNASKWIASVWFVYVVGDVPLVVAMLTPVAFTVALFQPTVPPLPAFAVRSR